MGWVLLQQLIFFGQILQLTPAKKDWEHLRIFIDNNVKIPSRTRAVLHHEESPVLGMIESINGLADIGDDFVVVPCNSAHYFYDEVVRKIKLPWLNIIEISCNRVRRIGKQRPLILGDLQRYRFKVKTKACSRQPQI